jgi:hypothetical protein
MIPTQPSSTLFTDVHIYDPDQTTGMSGPTDLLVEGNRISLIGGNARAAPVPTHGSSRADPTIWSFPV